MPGRDWKSNSFGAWLKAQRRRQHLTQEEFAHNINCAAITIRKIEAGERHPSRAFAEHLADYLGIILPLRSAFLEFACTGVFSRQWSMMEMGERRCKMTPISSRLRSDNTPGEVPFLHQSASAYLLDTQTDRLLLNLRGQQLLPMASIAKIMTTLIAVEQGDLLQRITIKRETLERVKRHKVHCVHLIADDQILLRDLLYAIMLPSGGDAALVVAEAVAGSMAEFVKLMNEYARRLHLKQTRYVNPIGTPYLVSDDRAEQDSYSTAADLVHLTRYALSHPLFAQIAQLQRYALPLTSSHHAYTWETTNTLLGYYAGATGVKTGYTPMAGSCLVFSATSGMQSLIGALLHSEGLQQRDSDAAKLLNWGFAIPNECI